jgi:nucleoside-diphosphate-sugar epimerase
MKNKKILITGGLGFLGSYSVEKWKENGWKVTVIDNLSTNVIPPDHPICKDVDVIKYYMGQ